MSDTQNHFERLCFTDHSINEARRNIFHSNGVGFHVVRQFLNPMEVSHLRSVWQKSKVRRFFPVKDKKSPLPYGTGNFITGNAMQYSYFNLPWNPVIDHLTSHIALLVSQYKNLIRGYPAYHEIQANLARKGIQYISSFRVVCTEDGSPVPPHRDWHEPPYFEPDRIQATLFLSEYGRDWEEGGFQFRKNDGTISYFGKDITINPGDLIFWRYTNEHGVTNVKKQINQLGMLRIVFVSEPVEVMTNDR